MVPQCLAEQAAEAAKKGMSTTLAAALSVLALLAAPLCRTASASPMPPRFDEDEFFEILANLKSGTATGIEADPVLQARFREWLQQSPLPEPLPMPLAYQQLQGLLPQSPRLLPRPINMLASDSEAIDDKDKRGNYMSLCHFKICNMGRKRNLRTPNVAGPWIRQ
ncbi:hypothetical protein B566_EDAN007695 [Ephemera danica]|nr:hypothetical protein B566_EDAN007695 [Ephemera danica]